MVGGLGFAVFSRSLTTYLALFEPRTYVMTDPGGQAEWRYSAVGVAAQRCKPAVGYRSQQGHTSADRLRAAPRPSPNGPLTAQSFFSLEIFANICERFLNIHMKLHINIYEI